MPPLEARKYLFDIRQACELLARFTTGKTFVDYKADPMLRSAVERQFAIIGEAVRQMLDREPGLSSAIIAHPRIIGFRNRLVHEYASISDELVWGVLETDLPRLRREVDALLAEGDES